MADPSEFVGRFNEAKGGISMHTLAAEAGVNYTTVARVMNGSDCLPATLTVLNDGLDRMLRRRIESDTKIIEAREGKADGK